MSDISWIQFRISLENWANTKKVIEFIIAPHMNDVNDILIVLFTIQWIFIVKIPSINQVVEEQRTFLLLINVSCTAMLRFHGISSKYSTKITRSRSIDLFGGASLFALYNSHFITQYFSHVKLNVIIIDN